MIQKSKKFFVLTFRFLVPFGPLSLSASDDEEIDAEDADEPRHDQQIGEDQVSFHSFNIFTEMFPDFAALGTHFCFLDTKPFDRFANFRRSDQLTMFSLLTLNFAEIRLNFLQSLFEFLQAFFISLLGSNFEFTNAFEWSNRSPFASQADQIFATSKIFDEITCEGEVVVERSHAAHAHEIDDLNREIIAEEIGIGDQNKSAGFCRFRKEILGFCFGIVFVRFRPPVREGSWKLAADNSRDHVLASRSVELTPDFRRIAEGKSLRH